MDGQRSQRSSRTPLQREHRKLVREYEQMLKQRDAYREEVHFLRRHSQHLECELRDLRPRSYRDGNRIAELEERLEQLKAQNHALREQLADVKGKLDIQSRPLPAFVKANVPPRRKGRPGRRLGHAASQRPLPEKIDRQIEVPAPRDGSGAVSCPHCHTQLADVKQHQRIVEDIEPSKPVVSCYHTTSGYCPSCRQRIETRAAEQPPAAELPHGQVGINTLATAGLMRVVYRMPYELISQLLVDLPGIRLSTGAMAKQMTRMGQWLEQEYERLHQFLRLAPSVHMDETSWRVDGKNRWLWALLDERHTLFHVDKSRGSKVVRKLLGEVFGGTLSTDFYSAYGKIDCRKQKCLVHLLRELRDTAGKSPDFAKGSFHRRLKRLVKELLLLKQQKGKLQVAEYQQKGRRLEERLEELAGCQWPEAHAARIAKRLLKHEQELTLFLWEEEVAGTNNLAERALRPAVVLRKITGGSRSERGAKATAVLMSVMRTARQQALPMFETFKRLLMNAWAGKEPGLLTDIPADSS